MLRLAVLVVVGLPVALVAAIVLANYLNPNAGSGGSSSYLSERTESVKSDDRAVTVSGYKRSNGSDVKPTKIVPRKEDDGEMVQVKGYTTKKGTKVEAYERSKPKSKD
jgi:hypothetical protein